MAGNAVNTKHNGVNPANEGDWLRCEGCKDWLTGMCKNCV